MDGALSAARNLLPEWILWANLALYVLLAFVGAWGCARFTTCMMLWGFRRRSSDDWVERARLGFPAIVASHLAVILLPIIFGIGGLVYGWPFSAWQQKLVCLLGAAAAWLAAGHVSRRTTWTVRRIRWPFFRWCAGVLSFLLCFMPHVVWAVVLGAILPAAMNLRAWGTLAAGTLVCIVLMSGGNLWLARHLRLARPGSSRLQRIVEAAAERTGIRPRAVQQVPWNVANALAYPAAQQIAFTDLAMDVLDDDEAESICVHELAHLAEPRGVLLLRYAAALLVIPCAAVRPIVGTYGWAVYAMIPIAVFLAAHLFNRVSRRMEVRADEAATGHQADSGTYARALEAIYAANAVPVVTRKGCSHPDLYDRLVAAGEQPDYPRPDPPPRRMLYVAFFMTLFLPTVLQAMWFVTPPFVVRVNSSSVVCEFVAGMPSDSNGDAWIANWLAWKRWDLDDPQEALIFQRAAVESDEELPTYPADLAFMLASLDRCHDARAALQEAELRFAALRGKIEDALRRNGRGSSAQRPLNSLARDLGRKREILPSEWQAVEEARRRVESCR